MADEILTPAKEFISADNLLEGSLTDPQFATAVSAALARFSRDFPQVIHEGVAGDGNNYLDLSGALSAAWDEDGSDVVAVDYPYTLGQENEMSFEDWRVVEDPTTGMTILFAESTPEADQTIKISFSSPWTEAAVPTRLINTVAKLAASNMARMLASRTAQLNESLIQADTARNQSQTRNWRDLAKDLESQYQEELGLDEDGKDPPVSAASAEISMDPGTSHGLGKQHPYYDDD